MLNDERTMINELRLLKSNYSVDGIKAEFEAEGSGFNDVMRLRRITSEQGVDLHVKIGGVEAIRDIYDCIELGVDGIIAPMVESPFGAHKFIESIDKICGPNFIHLSINIETINAVRQIDEILAVIKGYVQNITIGRTDLSGSFFSKEIKPNSPEITKIVELLSAKAVENGFNVTMGGSLNAETVAIYRSRPEIARMLHRMETRKVIMQTDALLANPEILHHALKFEELYILAKKEYTDMRLKAELNRLTNLKTRG